MSKKDKELDNISIKITSPKLNVDIVMPEDKALKYLKKINKLVPSDLKVVTKVVN